MIERGLLIVGLSALTVLRRVVQTDARLFAILARPGMQPMLRRVCRAKAYRVFLAAKETCPAYREFLLAAGAPEIRGPDDLHKIPVTTKENYVKKYDLESRCYGGRIPRHGVVVDESSGSSGVPNNWVRGPAERASVKTLMQLAYTRMFGGRDLFILNCFALGPWATGMNVSMSLVDVAILKSIGPDKAKLENAIKLFGPKYAYLVAGYPPFIKNFIDTTTLDLKAYDLHLILGGEGMSEGLRGYFSQSFRSVFSSYGASDLEINIGAETRFSIALRQLCWKSPELAVKLFGRQDPPMVFQYNPLDYLIETTEAGELVFTITRAANVAPKIRYNLHDIGGVYTHAELVTKLRESGIDPTGLHAGEAAFPLFYVFGRSDLSVAFFGCKVFTSDLDHIIHGDARLARSLNSFQIRNEEDEKFDRRLHLHLERAESAAEQLDAGQLHAAFYGGLLHVNQDFREISKMITPEHVVITLHEYGTGPFAGRDIRVKNLYIS